MRKSEIERKTLETNIQCHVNLDGSGQYKLDTGIGFFDHMLSHLSRHSLMDLDIQCKGDLHIDCHHTIEDVGIVLGKCIRQALGDKQQINRYGHAIIPMDESLVMCAVDLSGRAYLCFDCAFSKEQIGDLATESLEEFFRALVHNLGMNLHIKVLEGKNNHHMAEGIFKAVARALGDALRINHSAGTLMSTKGFLEV